jgi:glycosyltransferase involved in cell wall biosynthesis
MPSADMLVSGGTTPAVSIITPTKNRLKLLCEALDSVAAQTFSAWEHIVVDDGSEDGTADEMERRSRRDARIRFIHRIGDKAGANVCRNIGIRESRAELVIFLDSDDLLRPHCLERRVEIMKGNLDLDFVTFATAVFEKIPGDLGDRTNYDLLGDDLTRFLCFECPWIITGPIWRKQALLRIGCFDESLLSWQDVDLHVRAVSSGLKYLRFPEIDHDVRWHFEHTRISMEQRRSMKHLDACSSMFAKFEKAVRDGPGMNWNRQRALCGLYFTAAELMLEAGARTSALRCWKEVKARRLAGNPLYLQGALLLVLMSMGTLGRRIGERLSHKWKGMVRFRTIPELVG